MVSIPPVPTVTGSLPTVATHYGLFTECRPVGFSPRGLLFLDIPSECPLLSQAKETLGIYGGALLYLSSSLSETEHPSGIPQTAN